MVTVSKEQEFRAIILEQKSTIYFNLIDLIDPGFTIREILIPWLQAGNKPDRFTRLHDKNYTAIFEKDIIPKYMHLLDDTKASIIDINGLLHQTPGGMISNLIHQLREMEALDNIGEVCA